MRERRFSGIICAPPRRLARSVAAQVDSPAVASGESGAF